MSMNGPSSGSNTTSMDRRGGRSRSSQGTLSEINVTPLVDVMLVLLIIFMVSAPLMQQGIQVNLPKASSEPLSEEKKRIMIIIDQQKQVFLDKVKLEKGTLRKRLLAISAVTPDIPVFVQADRKIDYGFVAQVIAEIKKANLSRVGLVTQAHEGENNAADSI